MEGEENNVHDFLGFFYDNFFIFWRQSGGSLTQAEKRKLISINDKNQ